MARMTLDDLRTLLIACAGADEEAISPATSSTPPSRTSGTTLWL